jgi:hypothetical protein
MTFIVPEKGESIAEMRKKLAAFEARRLGFGPDGVVESRSLNPCGQDPDGRFGLGNTCAAADSDAGGGGSAVPPGRVPSSKYGMKFKAENEKVVAKARTLSDAKWNTLPVETLPFGSELQANEELLKTKPIDKVVSGKDSFREGYVTKLFRDGDGKLHIVDGHHRVAMYHALGKDMPVRIIDAAMTDKLLAEQKSERIDTIADILSKPENADGFTVDPVFFQAPKDGIMVSLNPEQTTVSARDVADGKADGTIGDWFDKYAAQLDGNDKTKFIGGWLDGGQFYLDVATRYEHGDVEKALEDARDARQLAVFNMSTFNDTFVHYSDNDPRKPEDYDTKRANWLAAKGFTEQTYSLGRTTVRSIHHPRNGARHGSRAIPTPGEHPEGEVHRGHEGNGRQGSQGRSGKGEEARSLNPCGQDSKGRFGIGNTCAASTGGSAADTGFDATPAKDESGHTGETEVRSAYEAIFENGTPPSEILAAYGWKGDGTELDKDLTGVCESAGCSDAQKQSVAGFVVGIGRAIQDFPEIADVSVRATSRNIESDLAEQRFRAAYGDRIASPENPLGVTQEEFDAAVAEARQQAASPVAFYNAKTDEIAIITDNAPTQKKMLTQFASQSFSSPSLMHAGYHEAAHCAHAKSMRREFGIPPTGPISDLRAQEYLDGRDQLLFKLASQVLLAPDLFEITKGTGGKAGDKVTQRIASRVSVYGASNPLETVAEYLSGVALGGIKRDTGIEQILDIIKSPAPAAPRAVGAQTAEIAQDREDFNNELP